MGIAFAVRQKANCTVNRIGAVIVKENRVVSTGYNGVPEGMTNCLEGVFYVVKIQMDSLLQVLVMIYVYVFMQNKMHCFQQQDSV